VSRHTPGPWKVAAIPGAVIAMDNTTIAKVFYGERSVCDANARLISAAPDLLDALKSIENDDGSIPKAIWDLRNAAIDKAEGKS